MRGATPQPIEANQNGPQSRSIGCRQIMGSTCNSHSIVCCVGQPCYFHEIFWRNNDNNLTME
ncbi:hypothetical protein BKA66DRAFT_470605 [Pyrenochaeta sp. MPI-SDFR-AT-0127]|nr:hypothetical protein BKA66DRAFT_470605 [Pyrenochaeta sp. MPI-SDFR-AT-0127]